MLNIFVGFKRYKTKPLRGNHSNFYLFNFDRKLHVKGGEKDKNFLYMANNLAQKKTEN